MTIRMDEFFPETPKIPTIPPTRSVRLLTGKEPPEKEKRMPTGVSERKPRAAKAESKPEAKPARPRAKQPEGKGLRVTRKSRQKPADGARFGVFEDGSIHLKLPTCTGVVGTDDARDLVGFLKRIGIDA